MPDYDVRFYDIDPLGEIGTSNGDTFVWAGPKAADGRATITDNGSGVGGTALEDDSSGENATGDVSIGGNTSTGSNIDAENAWTVQDSVTGQIFQIVRLDVENGDAAGDYLLSEIPLVQGRTYTVVDYDSNPNVDAGDPAFAYADYVADNTWVSGTTGDDTIDNTYTGDPEGDMVDDGDGGGATGNDNTIEGLAGNDTILSGAGADVVYAGIGNDEVDGGTGDDLIYGGGGSDVLVGGADADTIYGDSDPNLVVPNLIDGSFETHNPTSPGEGDSLSGWYNWNNSTPDLNDDAGYETEWHDFQSPTDGTNYIGLVGNNSTWKEGLSQDLDAPLLAGVSYTITIDAASGAYNGSDYSDPATVDFEVWGNPTAGETASSVNGIPAGHQLLDSVTVTSTTMTSYTLTFTPTVDINTITLSLSSSSPAGDYESVMLDNVSLIVSPLPEAEAGGDTIDGGAGDDIIFGEGGDDTILLNDGFGNDTISGGETDETSGDTLDTSGLTAGVNVTFTSADGEDGTATVGSDTATFEEIENVTYTDQGDVIDASATTAGMDIDAAAGEDIITGGSGNDAIDGGSDNDTITGGTGTDTLTGGTGADEFVYNAGDGPDVITDFDTTTGISADPKDPAADQTDNDFVDLSSFYDAAAVAAYNAANGGLDDVDQELALMRADAEDGVLDGIINGINVQSEISGLNLTIQNGGSAVDASTLNFENTAVACFGRGTLITTELGDVPVEDLTTGDLVLTLDNGYQPIRWIGSNQVSGATLEEHDNLRPIRIRAGVLGSGTPEADLIVSPLHRILVRSKIARRMFEEDEVLVAAKELLALDGIDIVQGDAGVEYFHFLFDRHEIVCSDGALTESLYTGPMALKSVNPAARTEILTLFPELSCVDYSAPSSRKMATGRMGRQLAARHVKNIQPLVAALPS